MAQATWTIILKVNSDTLEARSVKVKLGTPTREPQLAAGVMGRHFTVKPEASMVTCTVLHRDGWDLDKWATTENVSLVCISDAGPTYQIDGAYVSNSLEIADEGGGIQLEFTGPPATAV
jgi:hypothetical protein